MQNERFISVSLTQAEYSDIIRALSQTPSDVSYYPLQNLFGQVNPQIQARQEQINAQAAAEAEAAKNARKARKKANTAKVGIKRRKTA